MEAKHENEDWARLAVDYHADPELAVVADRIEQEHGRKYGHLPYLYWPRIIAAAKKAKSFGWFRFAPRHFAESVRDRSPLEVRAALFAMLAEQGLVHFGKHNEVSGESGLTDIRPSEFASWQSMSANERQKLKRARDAHARGEAVSWPVSHLVTGCHALSRAVTTLDETRRDIDKEETPLSTPPTAELDPAPSEPSDLEAIFTHWVAATKRDPARTKSTAERRSKITARLRTFQAADIITAISHYAADPFHAGQNDRNKRYDDLITLLKTDTKVEQALEAIREGPPRPATPLSQPTRHTSTEDYDHGIQWHTNNDTVPAA